MYLFRSPLQHGLIDAAETRSPLGSFIQMRNTPIFRNLCIYLSVLFITVGCSVSPSSDSTYWREVHAASTANRIGPNKNEAPPSQNLYILEFSSDGELLTEDTTPLLDKIQNSSIKNPLVVGYIHGWKNSAEPSNENLIHFNQFQSILSATPTFGGREIIGVYCGWPGSPPEDGRTLSDKTDYKKRRDIADKVGTNSALSQIITKITDAAAKADGEVIWIGHSLGGRILERTLLEITEQSKVLPSNLMGILMSPAIDSNSSYKLRERLDSSAALSAVSLTSFNDYAIRDAFRLGNSLFGTSELDSMDELSPFDKDVIKSAAFDESMVTHYLQSESNFLQLVEKGKCVLFEELQKPVRLRESEGLRYQAQYDQLRQRNIANMLPSEIAILRELELFDPQKQSKRRAVYDDRRASVYIKKIKDSKQWTTKTVQVDDTAKSFHFRKVSFMAQQEPHNWLFFSLQDQSNIQQAYPIVSVSPDIIDGHSDFVGSSPTESSDSPTLFTPVFSNLIGELYNLRFNENIRL